MLTTVEATHAIKKAMPTFDSKSVPLDAAIGRVLPRICRAVKKATGIEQYNILQNNGPLAHQAVFHVHFHIIPKPSSDEGLGVGWPSGKLADGETLAAEIRAAL